MLCCLAGGALKIFEALEMWDQLIVCYRLLDKKQAAQELVLARLKVVPVTPLADQTAGFRVHGPHVGTSTAGHSAPCG
jgi:hypothetical protein